MADLATPRAVNPDRVIEVEVCIMVCGAGLPHAGQLVAVVDARENEFASREMQAIARQVPVEVTCFLELGGRGDCYLRYWTPDGELKHNAEAAVCALHYFNENGGYDAEVAKNRFGCPRGLLRYSVDSAGCIVLGIRPPREQESVPMAEIVDCLDAATLGMRIDLEPCCISCGGEKFVVAATRSRAMLHDLRLSTNKFRKFLSKYSAEDGGLVVVSDEPQGPAGFQCRIWTGSGVEESSLCLHGVAAGAAFLVFRGEAVSKGESSSANAFAGDLSLMASFSPFSGVELKGSPVQIMMAGEQGFFRQGLKARPAYCKVAFAVNKTGIKQELGEPEQKIVIQEAEAVTIATESDGMSLKVKLFGDVKRADGDAVKLITDD